jgi:hypothetical protein
MNAKHSLAHKEEIIDPRLSVIERKGESVDPFGDMVF